MYLNNTFYGTSESALNLNRSNRQSIRVAPDEDYFIDSPDNVLNQNVNSLLKTDKNIDKPISKSFVPNLSETHALKVIKLNDLGKE